MDEDIAWFWEVIKGCISDDVVVIGLELSQEDKHKFLMAVCGSPNTPFGGFLHLNPPFTIVRAKLSDAMAPHTHTCFHSIDLPKYKTKEQTKRMIRVLIDNCEGFGNT